MNYFDMYGIKEVADVVVYSITRIEDEEVYTPVLMFDSLKVSSLSKSSDTVTQKGGSGNPSIISWSYIKDIKLKETKYDNKEEKEKLEYLMDLIRTSGEEPYDSRERVYSVIEKFMGITIEYNGTLKDGKRLDLFNGDKTNALTNEMVYNKK